MKQKALTLIAAVIFALTGSTTVFGQGQEKEFNFKKAKSILNELKVNGEKMDKATAKKHLLAFLDEVRPYVEEVKTVLNGNDTESMLMIANSTTFSNFIALTTEISELEALPVMKDLEDDPDIKKAMEMFDLSHSLEEEVEGMQSSLPMVIDDDLQITKVEIKEGYLVMTMEYEEKEFRLDDKDIKFMLSLLKEGMTKMMLEEGNDDFKKMISKCKEESKGFRIIVAGSKSGASAVIVDISPEELEKDERF